MKYAEKERRMYYDLAFMAVLLVVVMAIIWFDYKYLLERYIYVTMLAPFLIGRGLSDTFIHARKETDKKDKFETESVG